MGVVALLNRRDRCACLPQVLSLAVIVLFFSAGAYAQVPGESVNMVSGTTWPGGDPFLQRQNEPSMAVSSRNALHVLAGNNDYRTVDLPGVASDKPTGDAWLGVFTSLNGGDQWQSTLLPGYPQDTSRAGSASPLKAYQAAADPIVRAGSNGLFFYSGLAFNRDANGTSAVFLARYVDDNNLEGSNTIRYLGTSVVAKGDSTHFLDKPFIAVDLPRPTSRTCQIPAGNGVPASQVKAGRIYLGYTQFDGGESSSNAAIYLTYSDDCGVSWSTPTKVSGSTLTNQGVAIAIEQTTGDAYVVWRVFGNSTTPDEVVGVASQYPSGTLIPLFTKTISPFDQGTTDVSFRTNAYPSLATDMTGRLYVGWSQRGDAKDPITRGDARVTVMAVTPSFNGASGQVSSVQSSTPIPVDPYSGRGHQIMPSLAFSSGKLTVAWYDFRNDDQITVYQATGGGQYSATNQVPGGVTPVFSTFVADPRAPFSPSVWRHTVDIRAAQALPASMLSFGSSVLVSQYTYGTPAPNPSTDTDLPGDPRDRIQQLDFDAPNLPLFQRGTVPFVGDYIDVAGPTFVPDPNSSTGQWRFNNLPSDPDHTHVVWTDNRNVVQPADGNWTNYTPVGSTGKGSIFQPGTSVPACIVGQTGSRNQDIYTARLSAGLTFGAKGNSKQLSTTLTREFPVTIENATDLTSYYRLTIQNQPDGGFASFLQFPVTGLPNPLTQLVVGIPPRSSASRSVFVRSSNPDAQISVNAIQTDVNNNITPNGLTSATVLNSDTSNPDISNPNISNLEIYNPNISNPNISNPNISNPNISNPNISNPNISNPDISNPNISNPNISNAALSGEITDVSYTVTNAGNTATSYVLNLIQDAPPPQGVTVQLVVSGIYLTPVANACTLAVQPHYTPIANIANPTFLTVGSVLPSGPPAALAPTFSLLPGEQALITLRVYDSTATSPAAALADYNPLAHITPVISSAGVNTNVPAPPANVTVLAFSTAILPPAVINTAYSVTLAATGGVAPYVWSVPTGGSLPAGVTLQNGVLSVQSLAVGTYSIPLQVSDQSGQTAQRTFTLSVVNPDLALNTDPLPAGRYLSPYSGGTLSATGGTPPYRWSVTDGTSLPNGMALDANTGQLSGIPAQAGVFSIPVSVTDSATPAVTRTGTVSLSVGLATALASAGACNMPYPATPIHYPGASSFSLVSPSALGNQLNVSGGTILSGCLSGVSSGTYSLSFTPDNGQPAFSLPLPVIGPDGSNNGSFFATPAATNNLPPNGSQQGTVPMNTAFPVYSPASASAANAWGANSATFAGNFLFGLSTAGVQTCVSDPSSSVSLTAPGPGRFDLLFNGTIQPCPQTQFPAAPSPLTIGSVDAIGSTVSFAGATASNVKLSLPSPTTVTAQPQPIPNVLDVIPVNTSAATFPVTVTLDYTATLSGCNGTGCIVQVLVGLNTGDPQACPYNAVPPVSGASGSATVTVNVPAIPGRYYIGIDKSLDFVCRTSWWSGPPSANRFIAVVNVLQPPAQGLP